MLALEFDLIDVNATRDHPAIDVLSVPQEDRRGIRSALEVGHSRARQVIDRAIDGKQLGIIKFKTGLIVRIVPIRRYDARVDSSESERTQRDRSRRRIRQEEKGQREK